MQVPFAPGALARLLFAAKQRRETAALHVVPGCHTGDLAERRSKIQRRHRLPHHAVRLDAGSARDQRYAQKIFVRRRAFQIETAVAEQLAVIGRVDDERVFRESEVVEHGQDAADAVVDERGHAVVVGGHLGQLCIALVGNTRALGAELEHHRVCELRRALERGLVPPRTPLEITRAVFRQRHAGRVIHGAPRLGTVERMMRIGERDPRAERARLRARPEPIDGAVADPRARVPRDGKRGVPRLRRAVVGARALRPQLERFIVTASRDEPALVVAHRRALERPVAVHVT